MKNALRKNMVIAFFAFAMALPIESQEIGIQLYSLRNQLDKDVPGTLKLIKSWGIDQLEGGINTHGYDIGEYAALLNDLGFDLVSADASFEELRDNPDKAIERAKTFGADYVMCAWISHDVGNFTFDDVVNATAVFNKAGKILKENGLQLVYHPHGYEFKSHAEGTMFDHMAQNAKHFDFEMDTYWVVHGGEDPVALLKKYPGKFKLMHLKDMAKGTKSDGSGHSDVETNVVLGSGIIDFKAVLAEAKKQGIKYMFIEDESSKVVEQVPQSLKFLKSLEER